MGTDVSLRSTVVATDEHLSTDVSGETIVLHTEAKTYYSLNTMGRRVWALVQEPRTVAEIRDTIAEEYDIPSARCESDVLDFLDGLARETLVDVRENGPDP